ncbi:MAG: tRNA (guanosine(37)-N1)-methyltransferase TrmD [Bacteroidetes bacterium]|nr:tRNA (guanosine(37)-N1)-methyltransferase TrmD [Bacteroidota bacterium]
MRIDIITIFPAMLEGFLNESILKRAQTKGLVEIHMHNLRDYSLDKHHKTDDYAFGGGAGMVMLAQPLADCIEALKKNCQYDDIIYMSPDGEMLTQAVANDLSLTKNLMLICGRYKGIDQRIREHWITREISIGEYVLSGGELPAAVLADAIIRLIPGVLSDESSALLDSFQGELLDAPVYTRPADFRGHKVPDVLVSGDQKKIDEWRYQKSEEKTTRRNKKTEE